MSDDFAPLLGKLQSDGRLTSAELDEAFAIVMDGKADPAQIKPFLLATIPLMADPQALAAGARAMRARMVRVTAPEGAIDVCGTGGDGAHTLNISTAVAFVVAGAGVPVAKHGNRAMSSKSGAADVLEALGVKLTADSAILEQCLQDARVAFLFAQNHHPAMRHVGPARREIGQRTIFNLFGPLANPAGVKRQLVGVFAADLVTPLTEALKLLGAERVSVVHGAGGLDELSLPAEAEALASQSKNFIADLADGKITSGYVSAGDAGAPAYIDASALRGGSATENATALSALLAGKSRDSAYETIVSLNAGAALKVAGAAPSLAEGFAMGRDVLRSGGAQRVANSNGDNKFMSDTLSQIIAYKRDEVTVRKAARPQAAIDEAARAAPPARPFAAALTAEAKTGLALIAEIKKASPSRGLIRADFDVPSLAKAYADGGAACLSVLTDEPSFQGHDSYLLAARNACALPVLRKDFMVDRWQVAESRALGADAILIIMAAVSDALARDLAEAAAAWNIDALVECHDEAEVERALALPCKLIGINNRDLRTFKTDIAVTERLAAMVPRDRVLVAESGLFTNADLKRLAGAGAGAFLIGEALMRQADVTAATRAVLGR